MRLILTNLLIMLFSLSVYAEESESQPKPIYDETCEIELESRLYPTEYEFVVQEITSDMEKILQKKGYKVKIVRKEFWNPDYINSKRLRLVHTYTNNHSVFLRTNQCGVNIELRNDGETQIEESDGKQRSMLISSQNGLCKETNRKLGKFIPLCIVSGENIIKSENKPNVSNSDRFFIKEVDSESIKIKTNKFKQSVISQ